MSLASLETEHLLIRECYPSDAASVFSLGQEADVQKHMPDLWYEDVAEAETVLAHEAGSRTPESTPVNVPLSWCIVHRETGELIGHIGLTPYRGAAELGYAIASSFCGRGFATEAVAALSEAAIETFGLARIVAIVSAGHAASMRVLEKAGFRLEETAEHCCRGTLRLAHRFVRCP